MINYKHTSQLIILSKLSDPGSLGFVKTLFAGPMAGDVSSWVIALDCGWDPRVGRGGWVGNYESVQGKQYCLHYWLVLIVLKEWPSDRKWIDKWTDNGQSDPCMSNCQFPRAGNIHVCIWLKWFLHREVEDIYRIWNEFSFHTVFMKRVVCFISPSLWRGDIKHTTSFINTVWNENNYCMKWKFISDPIYIFYFPMEEPFQSYTYMYVACSWELTILHSGKIHFDSFYHMLNSQKTQFSRVLLPILLRKTRQRRDVTYDVIDEMRCLSPS